MSLVSAFLMCMRVCSCKYDVRVRRAQPPNNPPCTFAHTDRASSSCCCTITKPTTPVQCSLVAARCVIGIKSFCARA